MSRWTNAYSDFQTTWQEVKTVASRVEVVQDIDPEQLAEIARFKQVIEYVDGIQEAGLKDIMPLKTIETANSEANHILNSIVSYHDSGDFNQIYNANTFLDRLLTVICPFVMNSKKAAQATGQAFGAYNKVITEQMKVLENYSKTLVGEIKKWHEDISANREDISNKIAEVKDAYKTLVVDGEDKKSIKTEVNECYEEIVKFYRELLKGFKSEGDEESNQDSIKAEISSAKDDILMEKSIVETETADLKVFHEQIFGTKNKEGEREGGLKNEIETRQKSLDEYKDEQQTIIKKLKEQIDGLLPGATSAGLATAFRELKEESEEAIKKYTKYFYWSLGGLFLIAGLSLIPELCYIFPDTFTYFNTPWTCDKPVTDNLFLVWVRGLLAKSLLIAPALWFAVFTNKRRSEHQRLQQEYAHKESVSKSFDGYKKQIQELGADDATLLTELLEAAIKAIGYNASATLGGKHGEGPPITEAARYVGMGRKQ